MKLTPFMLVATLLLAGCDGETTLHSGLEERQANLVMAALLDAGIDCRKTAGEEGTWNVMVVESKFAAAVNLLEKAGLPRRPHQGIGEVFKKTGMISSPSEERIRFMDALAQDLAKTISSIDGVVDARVHVVLPENDPFARHVLPSSAAVAIRSRWDADITDIVPSVKGLVKNAIEGLTAEKIMVTIFRDAPPKAAKKRAATTENRHDIRGKTVPAYGRVAVHAAWKARPRAERVRGPLGGGSPRRRGGGCACGAACLRRRGVEGDRSAAHGGRAAVACPRRGRAGDARVQAARPSRRGRFALAEVPRIKEGR